MTCGSVLSAGVWVKWGGVRGVGVGQQLLVHMDMGGTSSIQFCVHKWKYFSY